jgi:hypothetical protein
VKHRTSKLTANGRLNPMHDGRDRHVNHGLMHHLLAFAQQTTEEGFTAREATRATAIFNVDDVVKLLERKKGTVSQRCKKTLEISAPSLGTTSRSANERHPYTQ